MSDRRRSSAVTESETAAPVIGRRITIRDVAESLQLSPSTVSLALNGKGTIAPGTRERVVAEAKRLGYEAHLFARGLRDGRSGVLGLSVRSLDQGGTYLPSGVDHFSRMAGAAAFTALDRGFGLMLVPFRSEVSEGAPLWVDGYVVEDPQDNDALLTRLLAAGVPVVTIGWDPAKKSRTAWVSTSDREAGARLLDLLRGKGARTIAFINGTERNSWNREAARTYAAWCDEHGVVAVTYELPENDGEEGGARLAERILTSPVRPDAIYCQTGRHAAGVARTATALGLSIPRDLMIVAGNDSEQARTFDPAITAIDLQPELLGQEAVRLLTDLLEGRRRRSKTLASKILERASTAR